jgi:mannose-6-phosphate isomerase-like protein (cupin superfamily)
MIHYSIPDVAPVEIRPGFKGVEFTLPADSANVAEITLSSRYPEFGVTQNTIVEEFVYVVNGQATFSSEDEEILLTKGSALLIKPNQTYSWSPHPEITLVIFSTPPWTAEQTLTTVKEDF